MLHAFIFSYELLHVLNFDPVRRRMSVLVKAKTGTVNILLLIKMSVYYNAEVSCHDVSQVGYGQKKR